MWPRPMLSGKTQARPTTPFLPRAKNPTFVAAKGKDGFPPEEATSPADAAAPVVEREAGVGQDGGERTEALAEEAEEPSDPARSVEPEPVAAAPPAVVRQQPAPSVQAQPLPGAAAEVRSDERTRRSNVNASPGPDRDPPVCGGGCNRRPWLRPVGGGAPGDLLSPAQSAATPPALAASPLPVAPPPPSAPQAAVASASAPPRVVVERMIPPQTSPTGQEEPRPPGRAGGEAQVGAMGGVTAPSTPPVAVPPPYSAPTRLRRPRSGAPVRSRIPVPSPRPTGAEAAEFYPRRAEEDGTEGMAIVDCLVTDDGRLENCSVVEEHPVGVGFGAATLALAKRFRLRSTSQSGELVGGRRVRIPFRWRLGQ